MRTQITVAGSTLVFSLALSFARVADAAPFVPKYLLVERKGTPAVAPSVVEDWTTPGIDTGDILQRLARVSSFEKSLQYGTPCADSGPSAKADGGLDASASGVVDGGPCEFGGEIEVQSGPGHAIIESDNTQEAIWIWSWQRQLAADTSYAPQIENAFQFLSRFPGWLKWEGTGDSGPDYYSIYNCAWGVRAVVELEAAWGDTSHHAYGATCAAHIQSYATNVAQSGMLIDIATAAFAASGLYIWGQAEGDTGLQADAVAIGTVVKAWVDATPSNVSSQTWAVTGAAAYDGVIGSYMKAHPDELVPWVTATAPLLGGWIDESTPAVPNDWTDWRNAHAAWNMLAQFDTGTVLREDGTGPHNQIALGIYSKLVAQDVENNGAIPGSQQRENADEDETWITAYLVYFGMRPLLADFELDAGAADAAHEGGLADAGGSKTPDASVHGDAGSAGSAGSASSSGSSGGCSVGQAGTNGSWPAGLPTFAWGVACALRGARRRRRAAVTALA